MKNVTVALATAALSCLLVACGGGTSAGDADVFSQPHPVVTGSGTLADMAVPTPRQAAVRTPDASSFLNWAESAYPSYFPSAQSNKTLDVWTYRYYPQTDIYLGTNTNGDVLGLVGTGGGAYNSVPLGKITDFGCLIFPSDCVAIVSVPTVSTLASNSGGAGFGSPQNVALDSAGNIYIADGGKHKILKMSPGGAITVLAGSGIAGFANGYGTAASFNYPADVAVDSDNNVYVADRANDAIRKITPAGLVSTLAGKGIGLASFSMPVGVAVDAANNVYVADMNQNAIKKISTSGMTTTLAGSANGISFPSGVAVDSTGNVYAQTSIGIQKISPAGIVSVIVRNNINRGFVDGNRTDARFSNLGGVAVDSAGNVYVADQGNHAIRKISTADIVTTLAGNGVKGFVDGPSTDARFSNPLGLEVDGTGNVVVVDQDNRAIRKITP